LNAEDDNIYGLHPQTTIRAVEAKTGYANILSNREREKIVTLARLNRALDKYRGIQSRIKDLAPKQVNMSRIVSEELFQEYFKGETVQRSLLYLPHTFGCDWRRNGFSGCFNCGMSVGAGIRPLSSAVIKAVADKIISMKKNVDINAIKWFNIYVEGSFLNDKEIPPLAQKTIFELIATETSAARITFETRPEYITQEKVDMLAEVATDHDIELEVAVGVETSNDFIRQFCVNKGFTFEEFAQKADLLHTAKNIRVLAYKFMKPVFLSEAEAIADSVESVKAYSRIADVVSIEIAGIQEYTLMEYLWLRKEYTMPSLWSVNDVMNKIKNHKGQMEIRLGGEPRTYYPSSKKTAHGCEKCTERIWKRIRAYNESHDPTVLETSCDCHETWKSQINNADRNACLEERIAQRMIGNSENLSYEDYLERKGLDLIEVL